MDLLRAMRVFVSVADEGSFAGASRALDLAPAIVTRTVAGLENHLGVRLINRTTRRLALTEVGQSYLQRVRWILAEIQEAEELASASMTEPVGTLRIAAPSVFLSLQLVKLLPEFNALYPKISLKIDVSQQTCTPADNADLSLLLVPTGTLDGDFLARPLAEAEAILCAAPSYLLRRGRPLHPSDLGRHDLLFSPLPNMSRDWAFERQLAGQTESVVVRTEPMAAFSTVHHETLFEAALSGMGLLPTLRFVVADALAAGTLEQVLGGWQSTRFTLYSAMFSRRHQPARVRLFCNFLADRLLGQGRGLWQAPGVLPPPVLPRAQPIEA